MKTEMDIDMQTTVSSVSLPLQSPRGQGIMELLSKLDMRGKRERVQGGKKWREIEGKRERGGRGTRVLK